MESWSVHDSDDEKRYKSVRLLRSPKIRVPDCSSKYEAGKHVVHAAGEHSHNINLHRAKEFPIPGPEWDVFHRFKYYMYFIPKDMCLSVAKAFW